jgi:hypothetical protein
MAPDVLIIRFPDGNKEFRYPEKMLVEGDVIWHEGDRYNVISIATDGGGPAIAVVEPEPTSLGEALQSEEGAIRLALFEA